MKSKIENAIAKLLGIAWVFIFIMGTVGACMWVTTWVMRMMGVL